MQNHEAHARVGISFLVGKYLLKSELLMFDQMSVSPTHVNNILRTRRLLIVNAREALHILTFTVAEYFFKHQSTAARYYHRLVFLHLCSEDIEIVSTVEAS
mmetsp:Transcript_533/g.835  ORF Transcript_533/g.835 Transcript_533/m.835 type:complete len:101 (-) Transcript_533:618-920(-)